MVQNFAPVSTLDTLKDLSSQQALVDFFEQRGYSTDGDTTLPVMESEALLKELHKRDWVQLQVKGFRRIGHRADATGVMRVYLYSVERVTQSLAKEIFRDHCAPGRGDETLAVLVDQDYANIEIVYVDRHAGAAAALQQPLPGMKAKFGKPQFRALSITRLSGSTPNKVVRALNRFFWPTQRSVVVQRALLSSAFDLVEWSEDYFNNRALFSDHYLNRMQDDKDDQEWQSTKESGGEGYLFGNAWNELRTEYEKFQEAYEQLKRAKKTLSIEDRAQLQQLSEALNIKVLRTLGFVPRPAKQKRDKDGRRIADYSLCERMPDGKASQQLVVCLSYEWDRNLDGYADEDSTPEALDIEALENPGAAVVALLGTERGQSEWAIMTNGKLWRLYSAKAHNRATNYYEIDLQEALAIPREQSEEAKNAFRYFWLFFRARAFIPALHGEEKEPSTFLDYILRQSTQYAVTLGNSLKKKIFDEVFEHFAGSLVHDARRQGTLPTDLTPYSEEEQQRLIKPFFNSTLTFLYRLLFVLYAESRSLLPVYERRGYYEHSLQRLKEKIKQQLANNRPDFERALSSIPDDAFDYYEELKELFAAIDKGNEQWNIPLYNGGLFQTTVEKKIKDLVGVDEDGFPLIAQATPEEILATHNIDNRALIAGFDLLARDEDVKRHGELLMIDYKSLGVRQLGSIYEGLLEFRLRIASERMVKIKGKMVAEREALSSKQYRPDPKNIVEANEVYIENDHHERKTTGSYYTPDYIVEYIVANTVGPVIEEKQEQLLQKFRDYEKDVRKKLKDNEALSKMRMNVKPLETILRKPELVDAFFDIKVLDPAMGSGHFLVEAVDYITRSMLAYLNKFPLNPITEALKEIRESILDEMEQQSIAIDQSKLDDINLLKRQVLKRCIYGVDLNPMAVELAKVSVWLDSFTVGAPLSFLDHHMRNGNSLLGARIVDMREAVGSGPRTLFDHNLWISTVNATKEMIRVGKIGDITAEQARESKKTYYSALNVLEPHKKALNVFLSRHYSNPPVVKKQMKNTVDKALDFLRYEKIEEWAKTQNDDLLPEEKKIVLANAQKDAEQSKFFHWDLEFPEVFIDLTISDIKKDGGFDAVIGNPPYVRQEGLGRDKVAFQALYKVYNNIADLYTYFIERGNSMLRTGGRFGMITANKFMRANYGEELRKYLLEQVTLEKLINFGDLPVFGEATAYPVIILSKSTKDNTSSISYTVVKNLEFTNLSTLVKETESKLPASALVEPH